MQMGGGGQKEDEEEKQNKKLDRANSPRLDFNVNNGDRK